MSLEYTFDITPGGASATSYVSVEEADAFMARNVAQDTAIWSALTTAEKERHLMAATRDLDGLRFIGQKLKAGTEIGNNYQRLKFPCREQNAAYIPEALRMATALQAFYILKQAGLHGAGEELAEQGVGTYAVAGIEESFSRRPYSRICPEARNLIAGWISRGIDFREG